MALKHYAIGRPTLICEVNKCVSCRISWLVYGVVYRVEYGRGRNSRSLHCPAKVQGTRLLDGSILNLPGGLQIPPLRSPRFPVETHGVDEFHAALSMESRTRGRR
jgi:hypothetical protein